MDITLIILSLTAITTAVYYFCFRGSSFFQTHNIPHLKPWPFFGNSGYQLFRKLSLAELIHKIYNLNPECKYVGFYEFLTPIIIIRDPELIKQVGVKHFENFPDHRSFIDETIDPLFAKNLFSIRGQRWKQYRTMLSPAFSSAKMKTMFKLMEHCAVDFSEFIVNENEEGVELEMKDIFTRYTNDVLATCAFGIRVDSMRDPENEFYVLGKNITAFTLTRTLKFFMIRGTPWLARLLGFKFVTDRTAKFFKNIVKTTIETRDEKGISRPDMIQLMMETRGKRKDDLTIEEMTAQAFIFFFAGFDTTSTLMCFLCYEIGVNKEIQNALHDEIDQVLQQTAGVPTYEAINGMKYLEAVINEALRLWPVAAVVDRLCAKDFELPPTLPGEKPFVVKKGMGIWFPIYGIQRDPKYFENPQKFDPNRFLDQEKNHIDSVTYMPFGVGPRMCIGNRFAFLETKALIFHLLARVELQPCSRTTIPLKLSKRGFMMKAEGGFWMKFVPRKNPYVKCADLSSMTDEQG